MNAGQSGCRQQLSETPLRLPGFERHSVEKQLTFGNSKEKSAVVTLWQALLEFLPGCVELRLGPLVLKSIQADVFHQNIKAVDESTSGSAPVLALGCGPGVDKALLRLRLKSSPAGKGLHVTEVSGLAGGSGPCAAETFCGAEMPYIDCLPWRRHSQ